MMVDKEFIFKTYPAVKERLDRWFGSMNYETLQAWEDNYTFYVVAKTDGKLHFLRLFQIGTNVELSVDNQHDL